MWKEEIFKQEKEENTQNTTTKWSTQNNIKKKYLPFVCC